MNSNGYISVVTSIIILVGIISMVMCVILLSNQFESDHNEAMQDTVNNTGIMGNDTLAYNLSHRLSTATNDNSTFAIWMGMGIFIMAVILMLLYILKR